MFARRINGCVKHRVYVANVYCTNLYSQPQLLHPCIRIKAIFIYFFLLNIHYLLQSVLSALHELTILISQ